MGTKGILLGLLLLSIHSLVAQTNPVLKHTLADASELPKEIAFKEIIAATTQHVLIPFDTNNPTHRALQQKLLEAAALAGNRAAMHGISAARPNEAGNRLERFIREALNEVGLQAEVPTNTLGAAQITGYPDIAISAPLSCYLELKTYNSATEAATQRTFYYSPSTHSKVTRDALHLLLAYQLSKDTRNGETVFVPVRWQLLSLENLLVELKLEFNQSNRGLYGPEAGAIILSAGELSDGKPATGR